MQAKQCMSWTFWPQGYPLLCTFNKWKYVVLVHTWDSEYVVITHCHAAGPVQNISSERLHFLPVPLPPALPWSVPNVLCSPACWSMPVSSFRNHAPLHCSLRATVMFNTAKVLQLVTVYKLLPCTHLVECQYFSPLWFTVFMNFFCSMSVQSLPSFLSSSS